MTSVPKTPALARLAFWSKNMVLIREGGMSWPGSSYTDQEWTRMTGLAGTVSDAAYLRFLVINTIVFIALAAAVMFGAFLPLASALFPVPAETPAWKFASLLAIFCLLVIGIGLQVAMAVAARWSEPEGARQARVPEPGDAALAARVTWQIDRVTLVMCGLLVPGILVWIAYDIQAGPVISALKWLAIALMALSVAAGLRRRRGA